MKTKMLILVMATMVAAMTSCKKDDNGSVRYPVAVSKTGDIKQGEPVSFSFTQSSAGSNVSWSVTPFSNATIDAVGNTASIRFQKAGQYTVHAVSGNFKGDADVVVSDSVYNPGGDPVYVPLTGDQIFITVSKFDSMGLSGLDFHFVTEKKYDCLNHTLLFDNILGEQGLRVVFSAVLIPSGVYCVPGEEVASSGTAWYPLSEGNHGFEVLLNGVTYSGSFVRTGSTYTFTWPYTSGVTLTPLILN
jgi:hypothetical protein